MILGTRLLNASRQPQFPRFVCRQSTASKAFQEGDVALIRRADLPLVEGHLSGPLTPGRYVDTAFGRIPHSSIIGTQPRNTIPFSHSKKAHLSYRVYQPTLDEYARLTPRLVTPLYANEANAIVSLLDIHASHSSPNEEEPFEIFEAGTGHGSLTLHLARAVHAANPFPADADRNISHVPQLPPIDLSRDETRRAKNWSLVKAWLGETQPARDDDKGRDHIRKSRDSIITDWKQGRKAIVHTLDASPVHSAYAQRVLRHFRQGIYFRNVDFHVGDVSAWIEEQFRSRAQPRVDHEQKDSSVDEKTPFLAHILLDLPEPESHLSRCSQALLPDGLLLVFTPSITQITWVVQEIRRLRLPLWMEKVVELGAEITGGRNWDVRAVRKRDIEGARESMLAASGGKGEEGLANEDKEGVYGMKQSEPKKDDFVFICRPRIAESGAGGGFLGVWRRKRDGFS